MDFDMVLNAFALVQEIATHGAVSVPGCLTDTERAGLLDELRNYELVQQPSEYGPRKVRQAFAAAYDQISPQGRFAALRDELVRHLDDVARRWGEVTQTQLFGSPVCFNELTAQQYPPVVGRLGIHRDESKYHNVVAIFVLEGQGRFCLCDDVNGSNPREIPNDPGDLILMRATGFLGRNIRPLHFVSHVRTRRTTYVLRQK